MDSDTRVIERIMPIREISEESQREKRQISGLHLWWARRPLIACRAAIYGALTKYSLSETEDQTKKIIELCKWENSMKRSIIDAARNRLIKDNGGVPKVLDSFAGGGAIPLESLRLGCETYATDLNPVAHLVELGTLVYPQRSNEDELRTADQNASDALKDAGKQFVSSTKDVLEKYYFPAGQKENIIAYLWAKTVKCNNPNCGAEVPLVRQYWLSNKRGAKWALKQVLNKKAKSIDFAVVKDKEIDFDPKNGTMKKGNCACPLCGSILDGKYLRKQAQEYGMGQRLLCVVFEGISEIGYRNPIKSDYDLYEFAEKAYNSALTAKETAKYFPNEPLPPVGTLGFRIQRYGLKNWGDLFNSRQKLCIATFAKAINEDKQLSNREKLYLAFALDKLADYNNMFTSWHPRNQQVGHLFTKQAIPMIWDYVEVNPFSGKSGSFESAVKGVIHAINNCQANPISKCTVKLASATELPFEQKFFDAVIVDPPYYDAIGYADLSDFFYVWLKRSLHSSYGDVFKTLLTPKSNEIIQSQVRHQGEQERAKIFYEEMMAKSFNEINRVLVDNGILVIIFAHKSTSAWETIINSLLSANFVVTASWPLKTEMTTRMRAVGTASLSSSFFIVCRKRRNVEDGFYEDVKEELKQTIKERLDYFWSQKVSGSDFFVSAIGPAIQVFGKYKTVKKLNGDKVSVAEFLDLTHQLVSEYALKQILHGEKLGGIDDSTRFYVIWRWSYDGLEIGFDDARKLAQALGAEPEELMNKKGLLKKNKDKVILLGPKERKNLVNLGESETGKPPLIDVIHMACNLWEDGNHSELEELLVERSFGKDESFWAVAQAIAEILPDGDKEKQLLQGLLVSKSKLSGDAKQQKLA